MLLSPLNAEFSEHEHLLNSSDKGGFCDVCFNLLKSGEKHFRCEKCDFDICTECLKGYPEKICQNSLISMQNLAESIGMINIIRQSDDIQLSAPFMHDCITHSYPTFHLYEEQNEDPNLQIQATRSYVDSKGNHVLFFSSSQANKIIKRCKNSVDTYINNHSIRISMHCYYPILKAAREQAEVNRAEFNVRTFTAGFFSGFTLWIGYGIDKAYFSPLFSNALAGARFINFLSKTAENFPFGCILHLTPDSHIIPVGEEGHLISVVPDHNINIDWSQIQCLPIVLIIINEIKKMYPNCMLQYDHPKLNMLYSLADHLQDGIATMLRNPLFANESDQKVISFVDYSIKSLQIFLRLEPKPFTILYTTHLQVYQANLEGEFHAFLSKEQLKKVFLHLTSDIRESLTSLADNGEVYPFDPQNLKDPSLFIKSLIIKKEVQIAEFYNDITQKIWSITKKIAKVLIMLVSKDFSKIIKYVKGSKEEQDSHLHEIDHFNMKHKNDVENIISQSIKKKIIPDLYNKNLSDMSSELAKLKHLKLLINLSGEIQRRLDDDFGFFHIDIKIMPSMDCIQKYEINIIV